MLKKKKIPISLASITVRSISCIKYSTSMHKRRQEKIQPVLKQVQERMQKVKMSDERYRKTRRNKIITVSREFSIDLDENGERNVRSVDSRHIGVAVSTSFQHFHFVEKQDEVSDLDSILPNNDETSFVRPLLYILVQHPILFAIRKANLLSFRRIDTVESCND